MKQLFMTACLSLATLAAAHADELSLANQLKKNYPSLNAKVIGTTPVNGIYEVMVDGDLLYSDETGRYFFVGNLVDFANQRSLTQERMQKIKAIDIKSLPLKQAIKQVKGDGSRTLYIFTDPDCPYCKKLEQSLSQVNNVTLYIFPYPITSSHPNAANISKKIWCAKQPYQAWQDYLLNGISPEGASSCANPIDANIALARKLNISGTPTLFLGNGYRIEGAVSAEQLEQLLERSK